MVMSGLLWTSLEVDYIKIWFLSAIAEKREMRYFEWYITLEVQAPTWQLNPENLATWGIGRGY